MNSKGQTKWKTPLHNGQILGIALLGSDILVLSLPEHTFESDKISALKKVQATLLHPTTGKKILEKDIQLEASKFVELILQKSDKGVFQQMLVRHTQWTPKIGFAISKYEKQIRQTETIEVYTIDQQLTAKQLYKIKPAADQQYLAAFEDSRGNLNLLWANANTLLLEQYSGASTPSASLQTSFDWHDKHQPTVIAKEDGMRPGRIGVAVHYNTQADRVIKTVLFDMNEKKAFAFDEPLNNNYRKLVEEKAEAPEGWDRDIQKRWFYELRLSDIHFYGDYLVVAKEERGINQIPGSQTRPQAVSADIIITVLDKTAQLQKHFVVNKYVDNYLVYMAMGTFLSDEKLHLLAIEDQGLNFTGLYGTIDLKTMKWTRLQSLNEGGSVYKSKNMLDGSRTLWFHNTAVLHFLDQKAVGGSSLVTELKILKP